MTTVTLDNKRLLGFVEMAMSETNISTLPGGKVSKKDAVRRLANAKKTRLVKLSGARVGGKDTPA